MACHSYHPHPRCVKKDAPYSDYYCIPAPIPPFVKVFFLYAHGEERNNKAIAIHSLCVIVNLVCIDVGMNVEPFQNVLVFI